MPDSFPPLTWGPPVDERDLDALLSGQMADTPPALRQVADALTALCAAPTPAELTGEAAARTEFRALAETLGFGLDEAVRTDGHPYAEVLSALAMEGPAARPPARHRIIRNARGASGGAARSARPHRARPPGRRLNRRSGVLVAVAGAALVMALISLTGSLPGPIHSLEHLSAAGKSSPTTSVSSGSQNLQARSATPEPSHRTTPARPARQTPSSSPASSAQSQANELCRAFYWELERAQPSEILAELHLIREIDYLAGDPVHFDVSSYCGQYVQDMFPHGLPQIPPSIANSLPEPQNGQGNGQGAGNVGPTPEPLTAKPGGN
jgi:hypothetical protein